MKIPDSRAAAERYVIRQDRFGRYPELPDDYGPVHAVLNNHHTRDIHRFREPEFVQWSNPEAACGRHVGVLFPLPFDTGEDDACPDCLEMVRLWVHDRAEYDRRVIEREQRRTDARRREWELQREQEDYEEFLKRQDQELGVVPESPLAG